MIVASNCPKAINTFPGNYPEFLYWGMLSFLLVFLFVHRFWGVYEFGQKIISGIFKFAAPLDRVIAYLLPFYPTLMLIIFFIVSGLLQIKSYDHYFVFFAGFLIAMHVVLVAQELQEQEKSVFKPAYFFLMSIVFIANVLWIMLFFDFLIKDFSLPQFIHANFIDIRDFFKEVAQKIHVIYQTIKK